MTYVDPLGSKPTIEAMWLSYCRNVLPLDVSDIQREETRRAFYAGAHVSLNSVVRATEILSEDDATAYLANLVEDLKAFGERGGV